MKHRSQHPPKPCWRCRTPFVPSVAYTAYCSKRCQQADSNDRVREGRERGRASSTETPTVHNRLVTGL